MLVVWLVALMQVQVHAVALIWEAEGVMVEWPLSVLDLKAVMLNMVLMLVLAVVVVVVAS